MSRITYLHHIGKEVRVGVDSVEGRINEWGEGGWRGRHLMDAELNICKQKILQAVIEQHWVRHSEIYLLFSSEKMLQLNVI